MRTWELNAAELLQLVHGAGLKHLLKSPTSQKHLGCVAICRLKKAEKFVVCDIGKVDFVSKRGTKVELIGKGGKTHDDGPTGEVFVRSYTKRKKPAEARMKSW